MTKERRGSRLRDAVLLLVVAAQALSASACRGGSDAASAVPPEVTVATPAREPVTADLEFTGNTAASNSVTLVARVEGYLEKIHFTDGAAVAEGELLFTIQQAEYQAQLQQAEAQVAAQKAAVKHATTELARYVDLVKEDSAPQTQVDRWRYEVDSARAALLGAQAQVVLAKLNLGYTQVQAPFAGRMGRHLVDPGNLVGAMGQQTSLAQIDQIDPLYVYFTIDERDLLRIREHRKADPQRTDVDPAIPAAFGLLDEAGFPHRGHLDFASLGVAPTTGTLQVRAIFANPPPSVLPGLFVRVRIPTGPSRESLLVPASAVGFDQQGEYVLVVNDADVVERRSVTTGTQVGERVAIESGVAASDRVVVEGLARAVPGRKVAPDAGASTQAPTPSPSPSTGA